MSRNCGTNILYQNVGEYCIQKFITDTTQITFFISLKTFNLECIYQKKAGASELNMSNVDIHKQIWKSTVVRILRISGRVMSNPFLIFGILVFLLWNWPIKCSAGRKTNIHVYFKEGSDISNIVCIIQDTVNALSLRIKLSNVQAEHMWSFSSLTEHQFQEWYFFTFSSVCISN